ncbi:hypothetical protein B296_00012970 [Ensete ventricosum]|uniref:Uncharacterized protein n=1 Tax=Ensete ventricosum TaxID=4639 RepID=A0A427B247_ENSVE|nr:hypothetical protein B296_00012970 [Ensete ventricosum]
MRWLSLSVDVLRKGVSLNLYCRRIISPRFLLFFDTTLCFHFLVLLFLPIPFSLILGSLVN